MKKSFFCFVSLALFCVSLAFSQVYIDASIYEIASDSLESSPEVDSIEREILRTNNSINNVKMMRGMKRVSIDGRQIDPDEEVIRLENQLKELNAKLADAKKTLKYEDYDLLGMRVLERLEEITKASGKKIVLCKTFDELEEINQEYISFILENDGYEKNIMIDICGGEKKYEFKASYDGNFSYDETKPEYAKFVDFCARSMECVVSFVEDKKRYEPKELNPYFVDTMGNKVQCVRGLDDYSFGLISFDDSGKSQNAILYDYAGSKKVDLLSQIDHPRANTEVAVNYWQLCSNDGKTLKASKADIGTQYGFDAAGKLSSSSVEWNYTSNGHSFFFLSPEGRPYYFDVTSGYLTLAGKESESQRKLDFYKGAMNSFVMGFDDKLFAAKGNFVNVYDLNGNVEKIYLIPESEELLSIKLCKANEDGSFIAIVNGIDSKYFVMVENDGAIRWKLPVSNDNIGFFDYRNGVVYFMNSERKLTRFAEANAKVPDLMKLLSELQGQLSVNKYKNAPIQKKLAAEYEKAGAMDMAISLYKTYLEVSPADSAVKEKCFRYDFIQQKKDARTKVDELLSTYEEIGKYSAQGKFYDTIGIVEKLRGQNPGDAELEEMYTKLVEVFDPAALKGQSSSSEVSVESFELSSLFPALQIVYARNPSGLVRIKNNSKKEIKNLYAECYIKNYMDFASRGDSVKSLGPGKECVLDLNTCLNNNVMSVSENTSVQLKCTVKWNAGEIEKSLTFTRPVTLYKTSAMTWSNASMLSCFIMPNDPTVSSFVHQSIQKSRDAKLFSDKYVSMQFTNAVELVNAMGLLPLNYVQDPVAPAVDLMNVGFAVDTVRFPAETLSIRSGDCDDMTTLFCSILESCGIPCAIITVPGHILAAFNTGLKSNDVWKNLDGVKTIDYDGNVWIPVETTIMTKGFFEAWKSASATLESKTVEEFIVISEKRQDYPPVSLTVEKKKISVSGKIAAATKKDMDAMSGEIEKSLLLCQTGCKDAVKLNAIAGIYHKIGNDEKAVEVLNAAVLFDKNYDAAKRNLASLYKKLGRDAEYKAIASTLKKESSSRNASVSTERASSGDDDDWRE